MGNNEPVCIVDEVPFEIPESWEWVRLSTVNEMYVGNSINETEKKQKYTGLNDGYYYIGTKDIEFNHTINYDNGVRIPYGLNKFRIARKNSILMCIEGGSAGKKIAFINQDICFGNKLCCFYSLGVNHMFLYHYLQCPVFQSVFKENTTGIIGGVSVNVLKGLYIPIPPIEEQKRIVDKLQELLPHIEHYDKNEAFLGKLNTNFRDQLKKSILQEAIQGKLVPQNPNDEPASVLLKRIREEKQRLIKEGKIKKDKHESVIFRRDNSYYEKRGSVEVCIDDEIPFEIPKNWAWARAFSLGTMVRGRGIKRTETVSQGCPCIRYGEIYTTYKTYFKDAVSFIPESLNKYCIHFSTGDIVFTLTGENKVDIAKAVAFLGTGQIAAGSDLAVWTSHGMNPLYLVYYMASPYCIDCKRQTATGDIIVHISTTKVGDFLIPVPPFEEQSRIVSNIKRLLNVIVAL